MRSPPTEPGEAARPHSWVRQAFLTGLARPFVRFLTGMDVVGRERLPLTGPAIIAANHASHMDAFMLLSLFPAKTLAKVRPVAAADYFLANPAISWVSLNLIGISPIARKVKRGEDVLAPARRALERGEIILVFPEGTRGPGDRMGALKGGVARLAEAWPAAPVIPIWIQGADRVLPKGARTPVPMNCTALVGEPLVWEEGQDRPGFTARLRESLEALAAAAPPQKWS
ncbi:MAG: 1-acyl-sn-glycerol-3-phosphate acyltransferase [Alphaproteobacteria bacterium]|nr:1-acyl-sn-glycerol-3-phosphate acyltransferase [Alphaproteobacteria bacterium]MBU1525989.1 1-acyl-sn-glycerol-3-phosphate acyltransferase [Alphaproteobacteria bacterium]MBU2118222.1 1-acyl-sn-glycerol-3-phosphate acyltransferase [Alphaproteobacteria bacterium]MBU2350397.1 1-acyl-sn-glycerol-3-phosphate acyltransferase [Alphaproteobacteria bacterium]MBU2382501.1 1-acyl-sn-glycerol-3-phosphate acyltransferase [Alphaproteobacteria bacterium]